MRVIVLYRVCQKKRTKRKRDKERRRILLKKKRIFVVTRDFLPKSSDSNFLFDHSFSSRFLDVVSLYEPVASNVEVVLRRGGVK